jgi:hypothetical protein
LEVVVVAGGISPIVDIVAIATSDVLGFEPELIGSVVANSTRASKSIKVIVRNIEGQ